MTRLLRAAAVAALVTSPSLAGSAASADEAIKARLSGYNEVPALSTPASGSFRGKIVDGGAAIDFELQYADLVGDVLQAHLHLGQRAVNGGIIIFLCSNLGNGPAGTPACPPAPATVTGTLVPSGVVGPGGQGIAPEEFEELLAAIRAGVVYANVHSSTFPNGEIRGQVAGSRR